ncbi:MAG TPA: DUF3307 domain-containing protein [Draconibacterium sp.]|nr:DUF3307 domain-containing protein [Draconibacterium sp.]
MNLLFFPMLAGHLIADFWLQPNSWVLHKKANGIKSSKLVLHVAIASILPVVFTFQLNLWWFVPVIFATHLIIDFFKTKLRNSIPAFLLDQLLHVVVLLILADYGTKTNIPLSAVIFWIYATGFILITSPLGIFTGKFLNVIISDKNKTNKLDVSGWIGILERIMIFIFITTGQFSAIGFLIAAKSVFRFNDTREDGNKKAEYFLLGTLISFTLAIVVGLIINKLVLFVKTEL